MNTIEGDIGKNSGDLLLKLNKRFFNIGVMLEFPELILKTLIKIVKVKSYERQICRFKIIAE
tara:strand:- start:1026 stop:1211 length:186 start_codon:yes stop_codon:yes gene_type:complete